eukprot:jgi/Tetstr1/429624/TSEL_019522.t1
MLCYGLFTASAHAALTDVVAKAAEDRLTYLRRFKCKKVLTGEERVAERLVCSRFFDTTAAERPSNGANDLRKAMDDKRLEASLHQADKAQAVAQFKGGGSARSIGGIRIREQERRTRNPSYYLSFLEGELARVVESDAWEFGTCHKKWALHLRQRRANLLDALGLQRNPRKRFWEPCPFGKHLGVYIDAASGMFYAPADKLGRLSRQATRLIGRATRNASDDWQLDPLMFSELESRFGPHSINRYVASALNTLLPRYNAAWFGPYVRQLHEAIVIPFLRGGAATGHGYLGTIWHGTSHGWATWGGSRPPGCSLACRPSNNFFKDHGREPMALGDLVSKVRKGLAASQNIKYFGGWAMESSVVLDYYIDPTAMPSPAAWHLFGWMTLWGGQPAKLPAKWRHDGKTASHLRC